MLSSSALYLVLPFLEISGYNIIIIIFFFIFFRGFLGKPRDVHNDHDTAMGLLPARAFMPHSCSGIDMASHCNS